MFNIRTLILIMALIILGIAACVGFFILLKVYLNRRLKGEGKIRKMPQPITVVLTIMLTVSVICNAVLLINNITYKNNIDSEYQKLLVQTQTRMVSYTEFNANSRSAEYRDALLNNTLAGYETVVTSDGDFECYTAYPKGGIDDTFFIPQYFAYIRYIGEPVEDIQMERWFYYDEAHNNGSGSVGQFKPELLIIGNNLESQFYIGIKTIIKIAPQTTETKQNWDNLPIHTQSYFVVSGVANHIKSD